MGDQFITSVPRKNGKTMFDPSRMVRTENNPDGFTYMGDEYMFDPVTRTYVSWDGKRFTQEQVYVLKRGGWMEPSASTTNDEAVIDYLAEQARRLA